MCVAENLEIINTMIAAIGTSLALLGGYVAFLDYRGKAALQSMRGLHEAQLNLCEAVAEASASLMESQNENALVENLRAFENLKHGRALALLDQSVLDAMVELYNSAVALKPPGTNQDFEWEIRRALGGNAFAVVHECRQMMARAFEREAGGGLSLLDANYTMEWEESEDATN